MKKQALAPCTKAESKKGEWKMLSIAVDSGACQSVMDPEDVPDYEVTETAESRRGENFNSATGEEIPNLGEIKIPMVTREMSIRSMRFAAAPVTKPLGSVKSMNKANHIVLFDEAGSFIMNKATGEVNMLREEDGNFILDVWVPPPKMSAEEAAASFHRQP